MASLSDEALRDELGLFTRPECARLLTGLQMEGMAMIVFALARHAFRHDARAAALLGSGIPAGPTTEISLGIDDLVARARPLVPLFAGTADAGALLARLRAEPSAAGWCRELDAFLARFGHRGPSEFDLASTPWGEDPSMIVSAVRETLAGPPREGVRERMARLAEERARAVAGAIDASPAWKRPILSLLARARDVFLLDLRELRALAVGAPPPDGLRATLAERERRLARFRAEPPPDVLRSDGVPVREGEPPAVGDGSVLRGAAVSPGVATGPVRRLATPDPAAMNDGDVLVLVFADPGWTPLFPRAAAVVMEVGGLMCHAAVVARELGVPAVFGVRDATRELENGERVVVDGVAGTVARDAARAVTSRV